MSHTCRCTWATEPHGTWGDCIRSKDITLGDLSGRDANRQWDERLGAYRSARQAGLRPKTTKRADVEAAVKSSDATGVAFRADSS